MFRVFRERDSQREAAQTVDPECHPKMTLPMVKATPKRKSNRRFMRTGGRGWGRIDFTKIVQLLSKERNKKIIMTNPEVGQYLELL